MDSYEICKQVYLNRAKGSPPLYDTLETMIVKEAA